MVPRSLRDATGRQSILARLAGLTPGNRRQWGRMDPSQLLPHLGSALRMALGERKAEGAHPGPIVGAIKKFFAIYVLPWPKAKIQSPPGAFTTASVGWERDRQIVVELIERFAVTPPDKLGAIHPTFGSMTQRDWDALQYKHLDHHLRQFGA